MEEISRHNTINYIELPMTDVTATKAFYSEVFGWSFQDWGPDYISFSGAGVEGGFGRDIDVTGRLGRVLVVMYSEDLKATEAAITKAGGKVTKPIFEFPGGRRFHFTDPNGTELAVWSE